MTEEYLEKLGEKYCAKFRPDSFVTSVDIAAMTITTYWKGTYLVHDAKKVAEMLGIELEKRGVA